MTTHLHRAGAAALGLALAAAGFAPATAHAATTGGTATLLPYQHPQFVDRAGALADTVRLTGMKGVVWTVEGRTVHLKPYERLEVRVPTGVTAPVVVATPAPGWRIVSLKHPSLTWTKTFDRSPGTVNVPANAVTVIDKLGRSFDRITVKAIDGVVWVDGDGNRVTGQVPVPISGKTYTLTAKPSRKDITLTGQVVFTATVTNKVKAVSFDGTAPTLVGNKLTLTKTEGVTWRFTLDGKRYRSASFPGSVSRITYNVPAGKTVTVAPVLKSGYRFTQDDPRWTFSTQ